MKSREWKFVYSEGHSLIMNEAFFRAFTESKGVPGIFRTILYINRNGLETCYVPDRELKRVREEGGLFFNPAYRHRFRKRIRTLARRVELFSRHVQRVDCKKLTNVQLERLFARYLAALVPFLAHYQVSGGRVFPLLEEKIHRIMRRYFQESDVARNYGIALMPNTLDILEREEIALRRMASWASVSDVVLQRHARAYSSKYLLVYDESKVLKSLRARISELRRTRESARYYREALKKKKQSLIKEQRHIEMALKNEPEAIELIRFIREQSILRFEYKEWFFGIEYKCLKLFCEIARRVGLSAEEFFLTYGAADVKNFLLHNEKLAPEERERRKNLYMLYGDREAKYFYVGDVAAQHFNKLMGGNEQLISELKGVVACQGKATGRVRVILPRDFVQIEEAARQFENGEILVTTMTQPNLVVIMKKATAVVTDQGGMTSHAAVISREFQLPCIVGTLNATRALKTGDLVEVDANRGTVKIITRAR